jgi:hypothetical protein
MHTHESFAQWKAICDHYAQYNCAVISVTWGNPPHIDAYLKPGTPFPPLPPDMPATTTVKFHEPKRVGTATQGSGV